MHQYHELLQQILNTGHQKGDRTGTGTLSCFGPQMRFDLRDGFPLVTTKKVHLRSIIHELLWFLKGDTNTKYLTDNGVTIWNEWALPEDQYIEVPFSNAERIDEAISGGHWKEHRGMLREKLNILGEEAGHAFLDEIGVPRTYRVLSKKAGDLGPVYGKQWRDWVGPDGKHHDQISKVIDQLRNNPDSRRIIVSAWNVGELDQMALEPCHSFFQFYTRELSLEERLQWAEENDNELWSDYVHGTFVDEKIRLGWLDKSNVPTRMLSCQLYQRSADMFLGVPFNIASYALLIHMVAQQVNMVVGEFVWTGGDVHIYSNHMEQVKEQLTRKPKALPTLVIKRKPDSIFDYKFEDFELQNYESWPAIKAPVAI